MSLSILLIVLFIIFLIPALFLPQNRIRFYLIASLGSSAFLLALFLLSLAFSTEEFEKGLGGTFSFLFPFLSGNPELTSMEVHHLSSWFMFLSFYLLFYLILFLSAKFNYVGSNPSIRKPTKSIYRILEALVFLASAFFPLALFFVNIRGILPLQDGFLSPLFDVFYHLGA